MTEDATGDAGGRRGPSGLRPGEGTPDRPRVRRGEPVDAGGRVWIRRGRIQPLLHRHPWVFAGSVDEVEGDPGPGEIVEVVGDRGDPIAWGVWSPESALRVRLLSWDRPPDDAWWRERIARAVRLRTDVLDMPAMSDAWRVVHGEGDGLPGLVCDRYGDVLVVQVTGVGVEARRDLLVDALVEHTGATTVIEREDGELRRREGLPPLGSIVPDERVVAVAEDGSPSVLLRGDAPSEVLVDLARDAAAGSDPGVLLEADVLVGQKTGLYLDQSRSRRKAASFARGRRVLDVFCHTGAFAAFCAGPGGAASVELVDSNARCLHDAEQNLRRNDLAPAAVHRGNAGDVLRGLREADERYGLIVVDPPAFARRRSDVKKALRGYKDVNMQALHLLDDGGILVTCSCSGHVTDDMFRDTLQDAAHDAGRRLQVIDRIHQPGDHPWPPQAIELRYLNGLVVQAE